MKIEKLPSGSYRVRKTYKKKTYTIVFDHKPTQKEVTMVLAEKMDSNEERSSSATFEKCALDYIESKSNVLSPSTIGGYHKVLRQIDAQFKSLNIYDIDQITIQKEVNRYSDGRSPKTVSNFHGFIYSVIKFYRPSISINTTLPQKVKYEAYLPTQEDIKKILKASKTDTKYHICFQLGILSLRRSEVCALTLDDIDFDNNTVSINKACVYDKDNNIVIKKLTKTTEGKRVIPIPKSLADEIKANGFIIDVLPHNLVYVLHKYQHNLNIPEFRFHDLRHYFASYAHEKHMSDAAIMATGGWKSDYTMKSIYRQAMQKEMEKKQIKIATQILK